ncbi:hypothetical protein [Rhizobium phage RHph_N46]|nr:hypothetical protein EVC12_211 [Rhizobium phage RHph_I42]QXV73896.1 hypothetical protein [Rhizobium phage RHph_N46]
MPKISIKSIRKSTKVKIRRSGQVRVKPHQDDVMKPLGKPRLLHPPRRTVLQMLKLVSSKKREDAKDIAIKRLFTMDLPANAKTVSPDTPTYRVQTYSKHNKHIHNVSILLHDQAWPFSEKSKVIVDCSCASHVYQCEWHMAQTGNSFIWRSNGDVPLQNTTPTICKHTYQALRYMLRMARHNELPKKTRFTKKFSLQRGT